MTHTWFIGPDNCPLLLTLICAWLLLQFSSARSVVVARHPCMHVQMQHQPLATLTRNIRFATASLTANNAENKWQLFRTRGLYNNDFKFLDRSTYCDLFDQSMHLPDNCNACMLVSVDLAPGYRKKKFLHLDNICIQDYTSLHSAQANKRLVTLIKCRTMRILIAPVSHWLFTRRVHPRMPSLAFVAYAFNPTNSCCLCSHWPHRSSSNYPLLTAHYPFFPSSGIMRATTYIYYARVIMSAETYIYWHAI